MEERNTCRRVVGKTGEGEVRIGLLEEAVWLANVHRRLVPDGVVDGRLAQRVDADAAAAQPRWINPGRPAILLDEPPGGLAVEVPPLQVGAASTRRAGRRSRRRTR